MKILHKSAIHLGLSVCLSFSAISQTITIGGSQGAVQTDTVAVTDDSPVVDTYIPSANVNEVRSRMQKLQQKMTMPVLYNSTVHSFIDFFIYKKPSFTKSMLERKDFFFPIFEKYLAKYNMPDELKYLSMIESALNPKAVSRVRAIGLWQFMAPTGRENGLQINEFVDERMCIEKSTDAACRYLRQLYNIFGDWELALAAYNTGPGNVRRAIRKSGNVTNYWELHPYLPRDTRTYVPQWTAIIYMMHYADSYGIYADEELTQNFIPSQSIFVNGYFNLENFSNASGISLDDIQKLNPHILKEYLPSWTQRFELKIPQSKYSFYTANQKIILDSASRSPYQDNQTILAQQNTTTNNTGEVVDTESGIIVIGGGNSVANTSITAPINIAVKEKPVAKHKEYVVDNDRADDDEKRIRKAKKKVYVVKRGDNLSKIADKYDVDIFDIRAWNKLKKNAPIFSGQKLTILLDPETITEVERTLKSEKLAKKHIEKSKPKFHVVQRGDTLWSIAQRYGGIPVEKLKKINSMRSNQVKTGQKIKLA